MAAWLAAIASIGTIVGGLVYVFKYSAWVLTKTPEQGKEAIDAAEATAQANQEKTGRP